MKEKELFYKGKKYTSYYQLEKIMGINRRTIQYRVEKLGLTLEEVAHYEAPKPYARFGKQNKKSSNLKSEENSNEFEKVITYERIPSTQDHWFLKNEYKEERKPYLRWLKNAPEMLFNREEYLLNEEEKTSSERSKRQVATNKLKLLNRIKESRKNNIEKN